MGDIANAVANACRPACTPCAAGRWLDTLDSEDRTALDAYAAHALTGSHRLARHFGATVARSTWALHHQGSCGCYRRETH